MLAVLQRAGEASVTIAGKTRASIGPGLVVLLGVETGDSTDDGDWLSGKICRMRIFGDDEGKMNRSLIDRGGEALVISQFTLHASTRKGNRPSFLNAAGPEEAIPLYEAFTARMRKLLGDDKVGTGEFGANMRVALVNDGPVTIVLDSRRRK